MAKFLSLGSAKRAVLKALEGNATAATTIRVLHALESAAAEDLPDNTGSWYGVADGYADGELVYDVWNCSECNYIIDDGTDDPSLLPKYCPNCGAKMTASPGSSS